MQGNRKDFFLLILVSGMVFSCQQKGLPIITERRTEPAKTVPEKAPVIPDPVKGKMIFTNRCSRCHALPEPEQFTAPRWEGILSVMIPRARLGREQGIHVTAYIKENGNKQ